jgi:hypothetical protein
VIDGIPVAGLGWGGLTIVFVLMVYKGLLVPRRVLEDALHDRDEWRAAHRISETARMEQTEQLSEVLEHSRTTTAVLRALPRPKDDP